MNEVMKFTEKKVKETMTYYEGDELTSATQSIVDIAADLSATILAMRVLQGEIDTEQFFESHYSCNSLYRDTYGKCPEMKMIGMDEGFEIIKDIHTIIKAVTYKLINMTKN